MDYTEDKPAFRKGFLLILMDKNLFVISGHNRNNGNSQSDTGKIKKQVIAESSASGVRDTPFLIKTHGEIMVELVLSSIKIGYWAKCFEEIICS